MFYLCPEKFCLPTTSRKSFADEYFVYGLLENKQIWAHTIYWLCKEDNCLVNIKLIGFEFCKSQKWYLGAACAEPRARSGSRSLTDLSGLSPGRVPDNKILLSQTFTLSSGVWWHNPCSPSTSAIALGSGCFWSKCPKLGLIAASA